MDSRNQSEAINQVAPAPVVHGTGTEFRFGFPPDHPEVLSCPDEGQGV